MLREYRHNNKGFTVQVDTQNGEPVVSKKGFVKLHKIPYGNYKGVDTLSIDAFNEAFSIIKKQGV